MDICGHLLNSLHQPNCDVKVSSDNAEMTQLQIICVLILFSYFTKPRIIRDTVWEKLEMHRAMAVDGIEEAAGSLAHKIQTFAPHLHETMIMSGKNVLGTCSTLLRAVYFNAHSLPVPMVPQTHVMVFNPILARLNHSCAPNCVVQFASGRGVSKSGDGPSPSAYASLRAVKTIQPGEKVSISYLADQCLPLRHRREILAAGFHFICQCQRCSFEFICGRAGAVDGNSFERQTLLDAAASLEPYSGAHEPGHGDGEGPIVDLGLITMCERSLQRIKATNPFPLSPSTSAHDLDIDLVYAVNDVATAALAQTAAGRGGADSDVAAVEQRRVQLIRANAVVAECFRLVGCSCAHRCVEVKVAACALGVQIATQASTANNLRALREVLEMSLALAKDAVRSMDLLQCSKMVMDRPRHAEPGEQAARAAGMELDFGFERVRGKMHVAIARIELALTSIS